MKHFRGRSWLLRLWRVGLLAAAVLLIREGHQRQLTAESGRAVTADRIHDFFPTAQSLGEPDETSGRRVVRNAAGAVVGFIAETAPESDRIIGYSGPTNVLLAFDPQGKLIGLRVLRSGDTPEHVAEVVAHRPFFTQFKDVAASHRSAAAVQGVSGATLTSMAIAEGVLRRLGQPNTTAASASMRFPDAITLDEVKTIDPRAASLAKPDASGTIEVHDAAGRRIGTAMRTAPASDAVIGYKGPTDTVIVLDNDNKVRGIALRKSYDTKRYVGYVTGDSYFLNLFNGMTLQQLADLDFKKAKIEGVAGATETSWAVAEGLRKRAAAELAAHSEPRDNSLWQTTLPRWRWQDAGHVMVILSALLMAFTRLRGIAWLRHLHHALLVVYAGFIAGEMLSQSLFAGWARHGTPWRNAPGLVLLAAAALIAPVFTRRQLYCHHICPHGALQQLVARRLKWQWSPPPRLLGFLDKVPYLLLAAVFFLVTRGIAINLNQIEPFDAYSLRVAGWATTAIAVLGLLWAFVTPLAYCRFGCPTGALFKLLRFTGDADHPGLRDGLAALCLLAGWILLQTPPNV